MKKSCILLSLLPLAFCGSLLTSCSKNKKERDSYKMYTIDIRVDEPDGAGNPRNLNSIGNDKEKKLKCWVSYYNDLGEEIWKDEEATIKGRGHGSWKGPNGKNPYKLKFVNKVSFFGLPASKDWALLSQTNQDNYLYYDASMHVGKYVLEKYNSEIIWTPSFNQVILNDNNKFWGGYSLVETIEAASGRVDIIEQSKYFLTERDEYADSPDDYFTTDRGMKIVVKKQSGFAIDFSDIKAIYDTIDNILENTSNKTEQEVYNDLSNYININTLVDYIALNELSGNFDYFWSSLFMYYDNFGKINFGPLWDSSQAFATYNLSHIQAAIRFDGRYANKLDFFNHLLKNSIFLDLIHKKINKISTAYETGIKNFYENAMIDQKEIWDKDAKKWKLKGESYQRDDKLYDLQIGYDFLIPYIEYRVKILKNYSDLINDFFLNSWYGGDEDTWREGTLPPKQIG